MISTQNAKLRLPARQPFTTSNLVDFIEWDLRNWSAALNFWLAHTTQNLGTCSALELGSRNGGLSLWMAVQGARVVSSDVEGPSETAKQLHKARGVSHLIEYEAIDATQIPYASKFDVVLFKSMLGAIGRLGSKQLQAEAIRQMHRSLKPGGELLFAENLVASPAHQFCRRKFIKWGTTWRYVSVAEMREFLSPFSSVHYRTVGFAGAFGRTESHRNLLGLLDQAAFNYLVPATWRYIIVGVAKK
jgi:SAM-dependent methyltransferase